MDLATRRAQALDAFCESANRITEIAIALLIAATIGVTFLQVVCRYGLDSSLFWSEEFSRYAFIWAIFLGAGAVTRRGQHMAADMLRGVLPSGLRRWFEILIALIGIGFFLVFAYATILLTQNAMLQISTSLQLPIAAIYISAPIGASLTILHLANGIVQGVVDSREASTSPVSPLT